MTDQLDALTTAFRWLSEKGNGAQVATEQDLEQWHVASATGDDLKDAWFISRKSDEKLRGGLQLMVWHDRVLSIPSARFQSLEKMYEALASDDYPQSVEDLFKRRTPRS